MKHLLGALLLVSSACVSCSVSNLPKPQSPPKDKKESKPTSPAMALIGRYGFAHACPVAGVVYTAGHVAVKATRDGKEIPLQHYYSQGAKRGVVQAAMVGNYQDIAVLMVISGSEPEFLQYGPAPLPGDKIHWWGYDYDPIRIKRYEGEVTSLISGQIAFKPAPVPGSSGTCILNEAGDVVGLVAWGYNYEQYGIGPVLPMEGE